MIFETPAIFKTNYWQVSLFHVSKEKKMLSIYLHHMYGLSSVSLKISSSISAELDILHSGANFVPIAASCFCFKVFSLKVKILLLRTTSASSTSVEIVTYFFYLKSSWLVDLVDLADRPSSCEMLDISQQHLQYIK